LVCIFLNISKPHSDYLSVLRAMQTLEGFLMFCGAFHINAVFRSCSLPGALNRQLAERNPRGSLVLGRLKLCSPDSDRIAI
jgi:hypothetical protein